MLLGLHDARNTARLAWRMIGDGCVMQITKSLTTVTYYGNSDFGMSGLSILFWTFCTGHLFTVYLNCFFRILQTGIKMWMYIILRLFCIKLYALYTLQLVYQTWCTIIMFTYVSTTFVCYVLSRKPSSFNWIHKFQHIWPKCLFTLYVMLIRDFRHFSKHTKNSLFQTPSVSVQGKRWSFLVILIAKLYDTYRTHNSYMVIKLIW